MNSRRSHPRTASGANCVCYCVRVCFDVELITRWKTDCAADVRPPRKSQAPLSRSIFLTCNVHSSINVSNVFAPV